MPQDRVVQFGATTLSIMTLTITTPSKMAICLNDMQHYDTLYYNTHNNDTQQNNAQRNRKNVQHAVSIQPAMLRVVMVNVVAPLFALEVEIFSPKNCFKIAFHEKKLNLPRKQCRGNYSFGFYPVRERFGLQHIFRFLLICVIALKQSQTSRNQGSHSLKFLR